MDTPVAEALAKLQTAMGAAGGSSVDPERRRAAALLTDLVRSEDDELQRFAKRRLPGRVVDDAALREARELVLGVARLVAAVGQGPAASDAVAKLKGDLIARLEELERAAAASPPPDAARPAAPNAVSVPMAPIATIAPLEAIAPVAPFAANAAIAPAAPFAPTAPAAPMAAVAPIAPIAASAPIAAVAPIAPIAPQGTPARDPLASTHAFNGDGAKSFARALPFERDGAKPPAVGARPAADGAPSSPGSPPALPFRKPASTGSKAAASPALPPHLARLDLAQHATLTAMLTVHPEHRGEIYARYGLVDEGERQVLERHWLTRLGEDKALGAEWLELRDRAIAHYRAQR